MTQIVSTMTVNQLVLSSLTLIGEYSPGEPPQNGHIEEGIQALNFIITSFSKNEIYIPFITTVNFSTVADQQNYVFGNVGTVDVNCAPIAEAISCKIIYNNTEYPVQPITYLEPDYLTRANNVTTRPTAFIWQRATNSNSTIIFYEIPDQVYQAFIRYKAYLPEITSGQMPHTYVPDYYLRYFRFKLGKELSFVYPTSRWTEEHEKELIKEEDEIKISNDIAMTINPSNILKAPYNRYGAFNGSILQGL